MHSTHQFMGKTKAGAASTCAEEPDCTGGGWRLTKEGMASVCGCEYGRARRVKAAVAASGVPWQAFDWSPLSLPTQRHEEAVTGLESFVRAFDRRRPAGLILSGGTGRGKTRLMGCVAAALAEDGVPVKWRRWDDVLREIKAGFGGGPGPTEREILSDLTACTLLCLDDLGTEAIKDGSEWAASTLVAILDHALRHGRPGLALTTNLSAAGIRDRYGERAMGRLLEATRQDHGGLIIRMEDMCDFRREMARKGVDTGGQDKPRRDARRHKERKSGLETGANANNFGGCGTLELFPQDDQAGD
jgi:DNA replication protein DnaC